MAESPKWTKSSRCSGGNCIEVAKVADQYLIRDSKNPDITPLAFTADEWTAFVEGVGAGDFTFQ
ncbi:DUF397 domain-containing protein [Mangrovihabitans endophyticus]|uniref:DUF397 domain-containing protein n=1 Tax=Mangrovihabitans endophyticus TaxID=1751298 RepID=UPI0027BAB862|nr:DUF397 domain-containing protein [Mangrovihabitans endophyticus]